MHTTIAMSALRRFAGACLAATACCAAAAPVTVPLTYPLSSGYAATGSVTYDDAVQVPNTLVGGTTDTTGLIAMNLTVTGPGIPGGTTSFTLADIDGWYLQTNAANAITDLNFFGHANGAGCTVYGVEVFLLSVFCTGGDPEDPLVVLRLDLNPSGPPVQVPTLAPAALAGLSTALAALTLLGLAMARRRARRG